MWEVYVTEEVCKDVFGSDVAKTVLKRKLFEERELCFK